MGLWTGQQPDQLRPTGRGAGEAAFDPQDDGAALLSCYEEEPPSSSSLSNRPRAIGKREMAAAAVDADRPRGSPSRRSLSRTNHNDRPNNNGFGSVDKSPIRRSGQQESAAVGQEDPSSSAAVAVAEARRPRSLPRSRSPSPETQSQSPSYRSKERQRKRESRAATSRPSQSTSGKVATPVSGTVAGAGTGAAPRLGTLPLSFHESFAAEQAALFAQTDAEYAGALARKADMASFWSVDRQEDRGQTDR
jgi:hypothetical protein